MHAFAQSYGFWKAAENSSFWTFFNSSVTASWISATSTKWSPFTSFSNWRTENSLPEINLESTGVIKGCNIFLGQKLANTCSFVGGCITVQQEKILTAECSWTNPLNALQEEIYFFFIKFWIYSFSLQYEFFVHYALRVKKIINMVFTWNLWNFSFFGRGDVSPTQLEFRGHMQNTRSHLL